MNYAYEYIKIAVRKWSGTPVCTKHVDARSRAGLFPKACVSVLCSVSPVLVVGGSLVWRALSGAGSVTDKVTDRWKQMRKKIRSRESIVSVLLTTLVRR
jgi:hypothetical protein